MLCGRGSVSIAAKLRTRPPTSPLIVVTRPLAVSILSRPPPGVNRTYVLEIDLRHCLSPFLLAQQQFLAKGGCMAHTQPCGDLEALCATCPSVEEVTHVLQAKGFTLAFDSGGVSYAY